MSKGKSRNRKWKLIIAAAGILIVLFAVSIVYVSDFYRADEVALNALQFDERVMVEMEEDMAVFRPENPIAGLIFYPGGKVEYTAYAPLLHGLAEKGVLCILCKMPLNLAVFDVNAAEGLQDKFPEIESWYIGGHSLGGSMASLYAAEHGAEYEGLILLAAYSTEDISQSGLQVLSLYGSEDGVLNMEKYADSLTNLPADKKEHVIEGGCHAQFGSYGKQEGDGTPGIDGKKQQEVTIEFIMELINS